MECNLPGFSVHGDTPGKNTEVGCMPFYKGSSQHRVKPRSPAFEEDSLLSEPPGKPMNTGVGSLSLLQEIFQTQGSNQGFLHCRWILYSCCQGSPKQMKTIQIRKSKACYSQPPSLAFGRLKGKPKRKNMEKRESYGYNLNGSSCPGEAIGCKTRRWTYYVMGKGMYLSLSGWF